LKDTKLDLELELQSNRVEFDEVQYYVNTADILYKYYDLVEKGHDMSLMDNDIVNQKNPHTILKYFLQPQTRPLVVCSKELNVVEDVEQSRGTLLEKYMMFTDEKHFIIKAKESCEEKCIHCGSKNLTIMTHDGYSFCNVCNTMEYLIIDHDKPSYKDPPKEISYFAYKRINHFQEFWMWWAYLTFVVKMF
jgi:hypothetical protein